MPTCHDCGGTVIEYDTAAGNGFCVICGTVVEEGAIVSEVAFGENAAGAAVVQGSFVGQGATHARMSGPYGSRANGESREQTIANATKKIQSIANVLRLSDIVCLAATRMYTLAVEHKFTKGRKSLNVVAVCLYVACRQKETRNYMLIDFSDLLQVNVFELGHTYLQLVQTLNLRLPLVDPSHYISRFAALLEFGDETHKVATDAVRLVQRFDRDWMTRGRRPAGICGAALLLAARMNNFRRSVEEIVQVVKIADTTLKKRLDEFKNTPSGSLTLADFRNVWLEEEMDPPAFTKGKEKEEAEKTVGDGSQSAEAEGEVKGKGKGKKPRTKRKSVRPPSPPPPQLPQPQPQPQPLPQPPIFIDRSSPPQLGEPPTTEVDERTSSFLADEVSTFLQNSQGVMLSSALDEAEERRRAQVVMEDDLMGLDEEELDRFLLSEEEVRIKERVWVELNKEYLESIAAKGEQQDSGTNSVAKSRKRRKTNNKPRDASTPHGTTAAESVRNLIKKNPKYSKRINYDALKELFVEDGEFTSLALDIGVDDKEGGLYTMSDYKDADYLPSSMVIIEEESGPFPVKQATPPDKTLRMDEGPGEDADADADVDEGSDFGGPEMDWGDAYEQEV